MTEITSHPPGTPCWAELRTPHPATDRDFYRSLLGCTFTEGLRQRPFDTLCLAKSLAAFGIASPLPTSPARAEWTLYFATDNLDATVQRAVELGATPLVDTTLADDAGLSTLCIDPTGACFGLFEARARVGAQIVAEPGSFIWYELYTRDGQKAREFYANLFGLSSGEAPQSEYAIVHLNEKPVFAVVHVAEDWPDSMHPHFMLYLAVENADGAVARVAGAGGKIHLPPFETPFGEVAIVEDPRGALFSLLEPPRPRPTSPTGSPRKRPRRR